MINQNTMMVKLKFPGENLVLGNHVGEHIWVYGFDKNNEQVKRNYTPISKIDQKGSVTLLIKVYFDTPTKPGGILSQYLHKLPLNSRVKISGPKGDINYKGNGTFLIKSTKEMLKFSKISMICGGTGITPMYQVIQHILDEGKNKLQLTLFFVNITEQDILLRKELE